MGAAKFDVDDMKFELYGPAIHDHELSQAQWNGIYEESYRRIEQHLRMGESAVHDSGNFTRRERARVRDIARNLGVEVVTIFVDTPVAVAHHRLIENRETPGRLDVTDEDWQETVDRMEPPTQEEHPLVFRYGDFVGDWIERNLHPLK